MEEYDGIPAIIGSGMARDAKLSTGDFITVRWRDVDGTFDASELVIADVFRCDVPAVDNGQIWIQIEDLQEKKQMPGEATQVILELIELARWLGEWPSGLALRSSH